MLLLLFIASLRSVFALHLPRSPLVMKALQKFWVHLAKRDRIHFDILLLLCAVSDTPSSDNIFQVVGCGMKELSGFLTTAA